MLRILSLLALVMVGLSTSVRAEDKKEATLSGVWSKEADGATIQFDFSKPGKVVVTVLAGDASITLKGKYTLEKDVVKATIDDVEKKNEFPADVNKGYKFSVKVVVKDNKATLSDFTAENADDARGIVEGEYTKKESK
jgi:uncharacterized protein (TIGR03066 family)